MKSLRKLGWTLLLTSWVAGGCVPQGDAAAPPPRKGPDGAAAAPEPAASPALAVKVGAEAPPVGWPWLFEDEDEFEGDGWTFWPLGGH